MLQSVNQDMTCQFEFRNVAVKYVLLLFFVTFHIFVATYAFVLFQLDFPNFVELTLPPINSYKRQRFFEVVCQTINASFARI